MQIDGYDEPLAGSFAVAMLRNFVDVLASQGKPPAGRVIVRQSRAKPISNDLETWLHVQLPKLSGKSPLAQAIRYVLCGMPKVRPYLEDGHLELDKNTAERAVKRLRPDMTSAEATEYRVRKRIETGPEVASGRALSDHRHCGEIRRAFHASFCLCGRRKIWCGYCRCPTVKRLMKAKG